MLTIFEIDTTSPTQWFAIGRKGINVSEMFANEPKRVEFKPKDQADCARAIGVLGGQLELKSLTAEHCQIQARMLFEQHGLLPKTPLEKPIDTRETPKPK